MAFQIDFSVQTSAKAETLWQVIQDLDSYKRWNPFVVDCKSSLQEGDAIYMKVVLLAGIAQSQKEIIFENRANEVISYGIGDGLGKGHGKKGLLNSYRSHRVEITQDGSVYHSHFELGGSFSPVVEIFMKKRLEKGFRAMTEALVKEAERREKQ